MALTQIADAGLKTPASDLQDNEKIVLGTGNDLEIYHDGTDSYVKTTTGDLNLQTTGDDILIRSNDDIHIQCTSSNDYAIKCIGDGGVELYYDNGKKIETTSTGVLVGGIIQVKQNSGNAAQTLLKLTNNDATSSGETGQTADIEFEFTDVTSTSYKAAKISCYKAADWHGNADYDAGLIFSTVNNSASFENTYTERLRITSDGKIGINQSSPFYPIHINTAMGSSPSLIMMEMTGSNTTGGGAGIAFDTSATNSTSNNGIYLATISGERSASDNGSNTLVFKTSKNNVAGDGSLTSGPKTQMVITEDGQVGIGTASPVQQAGIGLHIHGGDQARLKLTGGSSGSAAGDGFDIIMEDSGNAVNLINHENSYIKLSTNDVERVRVQAGGGISFNGDSAAANALDDYEEGTFNIVLTPGGGSYSTSHMQASYTRIGNVCHIQGWWRAASVSSISGGLTLSGFPFSCFNNTGSGGLRQQMNVMVAYATSMSETDVQLRLTDNTSTGVLMSLNNTEDTFTTWTSGNIQGATAIYLNGSYLTT